MYLFILVTGRSKPLGLILLCNQISGRPFWGEGVDVIMFQFKRGWMNSDVTRTKDKKEKSRFREYVNSSGGGAGFEDRLLTCQICA